MNGGPATSPAWFDLDAPPDLEIGPIGDVDAPADVVVVGLGASGLAACDELARRGADVVGIDAVGIAGAAAGANGGFLLAGLALFHHVAVATLGHERARTAYAWTLDLLDELFDDEPTGDRTGSLRLASGPEEEADVRAHGDALRADGFPVHPWDGPEGIGLLVPTDGVVHPVARCRRMARAAEAAGARLHAPARAVEVAPGRVRLAGGRSLRARDVLVAVDGGLEDLLPSLRVRSARLQMLATAPTTEVDRRRPEYRRWGLDYLQQLPSGEVLLGGGRDVGGDAEWSGVAEPTATVQAHLDALMAELRVTAAVTHRWAARAAFTDDRLPTVATLAAGLHVVGAYSGHGNVLGPALARRAADAILDGHLLSLPF